MELNRIGVDFKDIRQNHMVQHTVANIVLIDRTPPNVKPLLYILKQENSFNEHEFESIKNELMNSHRDDFIHLGEVLYIDKKKKLITLDNQNTVSYTHLIMAIGNENALVTNEFLAGIQTLINAIRMQKKIPNSLSNETEAEPRKKRSTQMNSSEKKGNLQRKKIQDIEAREHLKSMIDSSRDLSLTGTTKRLYQVQI